MNILKSAALAAALVLASFTAASAHEIKLGDMVIGHPWAKQSPMAHDVAAGFMLLTNNGKTDDRLIKVTAEITPVVQLHDMKMQGDVMKMTELTDGIVIPAGGEVELKPKSLHVMFMGVKTHLAEGEVFKGTLTFEKAGTVNVEFEVVGGMNMDMN